MASRKPSRWLTPSHKESWSAYRSLLRCWSASNSGPASGSSRASYWKLKFSLWSVGRYVNNDMLLPVTRREADKSSTFRLGPVGLRLTNCRIPNRAINGSVLGDLLFIRQWLVKKPFRLRQGLSNKLFRKPMVLDVEESRVLARGPHLCPRPFRASRSPVIGVRSIMGTSSSVAGLGGIMETSLNTGPCAL